MEALDLSRVEHLFLKENYLLGLGFPDGFIFARIARREVVTYLYDEVSAVAADTWVSSAQQGISARNIENAFRVPTAKDHVLQLFYGIAPSALRTYLGYPVETPQSNLDVAARLEKSDFGYVDGFTSPLNHPAPESEVWIPYRLNAGWAFYNPTNDSISPLLKFIVLRYSVEYIRNIDLIRRILDRRVECRLATLGGLSSYTYPYRENLGLDPIKLSATDEQIREAVKA
jgi:hypothetical protein